MLSVWKLNIECFHRRAIPSHSPRRYLKFWCLDGHVHTGYVCILSILMRSQRSHFPIQSLLPRDQIARAACGKQQRHSSRFLTRSLNCHFSFKLMFNAQNIKAITFWIWKPWSPWIICFYFHIVFNMYQRLFLNAAPVVLHSTPKTYVRIRRNRLWASRCVPCSSRDCLPIQTFQMASPLKPLCGKIILDLTKEMVHLAARLK